LVFLAPLGPHVPEALRFFLGLLMRRCLVKDGRDQGNGIGVITLGWIDHVVLPRDDGYPGLADIHEDRQRVVYRVP
jgi:hypothetical protein